MALTKNAYKDFCLNSLRSLISSKKRYFWAYFGPPKSYRDSTYELVCFNHRTNRVFGCVDFIFLHHFK